MNMELVLNNSSECFIDFVTLQMIFKEKKEMMIKKDTILKKLKINNIKSK